jgi:hypothetical protein
LGFRHGSAWTLNQDHLAIWEKLLRLGIDKANDAGIETVAFLDLAGETLSQDFDPTSASTCSVADLLLSVLAEKWAEEDFLVPSGLTAYVNEALRSIYPPEAANMTPSGWMLRTLMKTIENCPTIRVSELLSQLQEGLSVWFADEYRYFSGEDFDDVSFLEVGRQRF